MEPLMKTLRALLLGQALFLGLVGSVTLLSGCGGESSDSSTGTTAPPAPEPTPDQAAGSAAAAGEAAKGGSGSNPQP
jgi:hypothetical protein